MPGDPFRHAQALGEGQRPGYRLQHSHVEPGYWPGEVQGEHAAQVTRHGLT